jgi:putative SOS response-associated peptidase YedK
MCGRYASARSVDDIAGAFGITHDDVDSDLPAADWNVAPTKTVPAVLVRDGRPALTGLRWGLVPSWAASPSDGATPIQPTLFNARIETVTDMPAFRDAVRRRRCLLPADGWYEWARLPDGRRVPHFLTTPGDGLVALAGLWETWRDAEGRELRSTTILTGAAPPDLAHVHDRAPVVVEATQWRSWLDPSSTELEVRSMLRPTRAGLIRVWPVSDRVGDVRANGPDLATPIELDEQPALF